MTDEDIIEKVREFATISHAGQLRKYSPDPYIVHPIRVMELCREHTDDVCILAAALLHDVLEDTAVTKEQMLTFLKTVMPSPAAERTLKLVVELTDVYVKKDYPQYNRRKRKEMERNRIEATSKDSQTIKYADIIDNCREIVKHDPDFARVFLHECRTLLKKTPSGNPELYEQAKNIVYRNLEKCGGGSG